MYLLIYCDGDYWLSKTTEESLGAEAYTYLVSTASGAIVAPKSLSLISQSLGGWRL